jgi:Glycosyl hydrolase family 99
VSRRRSVAALAAAVVALAIAATLGLTTDRAWASGAPAAQPIPALAYYYIWFNPSSWRRAKRDIPLLGRYSSDEQQVMRTHVEWAKSAGLDGFIVSWKSTTPLDRRLAKLVAIADAKHFKLAVIYEGLDFERRPLSVGKVYADLEQFAAEYGRNPAFHVFGKKPTVIWSGTWEFTTQQVASVTRRLRGRLDILASEKNLAGYQRLAGVVGGDAYYWSSANPDTYPDYPKKLVEMGAAVHARHGLWIAPASVGFDARLLGGHTIVPRKNGETLRTEYSGALASSPDAVGVISWNEFSENSQIEPSTKYGDKYLKVLADILGAPGPAASDFDSDQPGAGGRGYSRILWIALIGGITLSFLALLMRQRQRGGTSTDAHS